MSDRTDVLDIVVLCGGPSPEAEVSRRSGQAVAKGLQRAGHQARLAEADRDGLLALAAAQPDCVWLALHGPWGEDGTVQGFLETLAVPYTGSGLLASALAMDKLATRRHLAGADVRMAPALAFDLDRARGAALPAGWGFPVIVKPNKGGSSIATARVDGADGLEAAVYDALKVDDLALVEPFLDGRELSVGLLDETVLGDIEIVPPEGIYDYDAKYERGGTEYIPSPKLPGEVRAEMHRMAQAAVRGLGTEGAVRADFIWVPDDGVYFMEINTIPGMTEKSLLPQIAAAAGMDFEELVERVAWDARTKC